MSMIYVLIPMCPLLSALAIGLFGRRWGESCRRVGTAAIGVSFGCVCLALLDQLSRGEAVSIPLYRFLRSGELTIDVSLYADQLSVLVLMLITGVSFVVHGFSSRYMIGDHRHARFFALMSLFTFAMIALVVSQNLLTMFMAWELMGICSYLLISHQSDRSAACRAATKAFLVNAIADMGMLLGIALVYTTFGTLDLREVLRLVPEMKSNPAITPIVLCLFLGCMGKSAQMPLHVWLPQAMEAPTPVSALIHAATMVNAGPFLLIRLSPLILLSPTAMTCIAIVGGTTALLAGVTSLTQSDVKKSLAFSTISQIGFMFFACGVGAFVAATFHMLAHGIIKGYLFLSSGSQLDSKRESSHETMAKGRPTFSLAAGGLVLACLGPLVFFSGPYGELWTANGTTAAGTAFVSLGLVAVFVAGFISTRAVASIFAVPPSSTVQPRFFSAFHSPVLLAMATVLIGFLVCFWVWFVSFLLPVMGVAQHRAPGLGLQAIEAWSPFSWFGTALLVAVAGWALGCLLPLRSGISSVLPLSVRDWFFVHFLNQLYFDAVYQAWIVRPCLGGLRWFWRNFEEAVVQRGVRQFAMGCLAAAGVVWKVVDVRGEGSLGTGGVSARPLQHQLLIQILWLFAALTLFYWFVLSP